VSRRGPAAGRRPADTKPAADVARQAWGDPPPDWVAVLAEACQTRSQGLVAKRIGYSASVVSQILRGSYRGDLQRVEMAVRGALMAEEVRCPVLGDIARDVCLHHQKRGFDCTSALRARIYRACRSGCPNYLGGERHGDTD